MPKFQITATFDLTTEIECEVRSSSFAPADEADYEDDSYFQSYGVESSGGSLKWTVEAEDEDAALRAAGEIIFDGQEVEDDNGLTWLIDSLSVEAEEIEPEMDLDSAKQIIAEWLNTAMLPEKVREAFRFLLDSTATPFNQ